MMDTDWFRTSPEEALRAESMLRAFHENRLGDIGDMLAVDYAADAETDPLQLLIAMMSFADRLAEYAVILHREHLGQGAEYEDVIREARRVVAEAVMPTEGEDDNE